MQASVAEEAVIERALARGFLSPAQVDAARRAHAEAARAGRPSTLLGQLAPHLRPADRDELRGVYTDALQAGGTTAADADAEATQQLDAPSRELLARMGTPELVDRTAAAAGSVKLAPPPAPGGPGTAATLPLGRAAGAPAVEVSGFTIVRELGRGGMGVVYEARHAGLGRVALKVLLAGDVAGEEDVERFKLEAKAAASLEHPNVVKVLQHGQDAQQRWYMAMELVDGESLEALVRREGALPTLVAARLTRDIARALAAAHGRSILHRDVKPHNVLMDGDTPRLTDFGLAKLTGEARSRSLTASGPGVLGTPGYMAPEQAGGERKRVDARADVYGLGALLYHLLTGRAPFEGDSLANVLVAVLQRAPVPLTTLRPGLARDLETICLKCLEKDPGQRYATANAVAEDLERFIRSEEITARPAGPLRRGLRWLRGHGVAAGLAVTGVLALTASVVLTLAARAGSGGASAELAAVTEPDAPGPPRPSPPPEVAPAADAASATATTEVPAPARPTEAPQRVTEAPQRVTEAAPRVTEAAPRATEVPARARPTEAAPRATEAAPRATEAAPRVTETPPRATEAPPHAIGAPPASATEAAPRATEAPPRVRPAETEAPPAPPREAQAPPAPPGETDAPRRATETSAPAAGPAPAAPVTEEPPLAPAVEPPPKWVLERLDVIQRARAEGPAQVPWSRTLRLALAEAQVRNVPLVIVLLDFEEELPAPLRDARIVAELDERCVLVVGQKDESDDEPHPSETVGGELRCKQHRVLTCDDHGDVRRELRKDDAADRPLGGEKLELADKEDVRIVVRAPDGAPLDALSDRPDRSGARRLDADALHEAIALALARVGRPALGLAKLRQLAGALEGLRRPDDVREALRTLEEAAGSAPHPLLRQAAAHALEDEAPRRCAVAIDDVLREHRGSRAQRELRRLLAAWKLPRCEELIRAALARERSD